MSTKRCALEALCLIVLVLVVVLVVDWAGRARLPKDLIRIAKEFRAPLLYRSRGLCVIGRRTKQSTDASIRFGYPFQVVREPRPTNHPIDDEDDDEDEDDSRNAAHLS